MSDTDHQANSVPDATLFPPAMLAASRWLLRDAAKIPLYVAGGRRVGTLDGERDQARLTTFAVAATTLLAHPERATGLGFALGHGWHGADLDGCLNDNGDFVKDWAAAFVDEARNAGCYVEKSPSRHGVHVMGYGPLPEGSCHGKDGNGIEIYDHGRYFTVTGWRLGALPERPMGSMAGAMVLLPKGRAKPKLVVSNTPPETGQNGPTAHASVGVSTTWLHERARATEALKAISADCTRDEWIKIGMALHHASKGHPEGCAIWEAWSMTAPHRYAGDCAYQWQSLKGETESPVTLGSLYARAKVEGWVPPEMRAENAPDTSHLNVGGSDALTAFVLDRARHQRDPAAIVKTSAPAFYIEGLLLDRVAGTLVAPGGTSKTTLLIHLGISTALGRDWLGRKVAAGSFVLFSLDDPQEDLDEARARVIGSMKLDAAAIALVSQRVRLVSLRGFPEVLTFANTNDRGMAEASGLRERLTAAVRALGLTDLRCVVLDTLRQFAGGTTNDDRVVTIATQAVTGMVDALGCVGMVSHHSTKAAVRDGIDADQYYGSGSAALGDNLRFVWVLTRVEERDPDKRAEILTRDYHIDPMQAPLAASASQLLVLTDTRGSLIRERVDPMMVARDGYQFHRIDARRKSRAEKVEQGLAGAREAIVAILREGAAVGKVIIAGLRERGLGGRTADLQGVIGGLEQEGVITRLERDKHGQPRGAYTLGAGSQKVGASPGASDGSQHEGG